MVNQRKLMFNNSPFICSVIEKPLTLNNKRKMIKQALYDLLAEGKLKEVFTEIKKLAATQSDYFSDPITLLQSRFNRNEKENEGGLTSPSDYKIERNRIENAVRSLIKDELDERKIPATFKIETSKQTAVVTPNFQGTNAQGDKVLKLFISYSKSDKELLGMFKRHLSPLERNKTIEIWDDTKLNAGENWQEAIKHQLRTADIIVFLVSADMIATNFIWDDEMPIAFGRYQQKQVAIVPIILRDCGWQDTTFGELNAIPEKGTPITSYRPQDDGWNIVYNKLKDLIKTINK
jgi:hypothetical protein